MPSSVTLSSTEEALIKWLAAAGGEAHIDLLIQQGNSPAEQISAMLLQLELKGMV